MSIKDKAALEKRLKNVEFYAKHQALQYQGEALLDLIAVIRALVKRKG